VKTDPVATRNEQEKERHGCNECHKKDKVETRMKTKREEDEDLVCEQATTTTGPLSVSRAFEEMTKERQQSGDRPVNKRRHKRNKLAGKCQDGLILMELHAIWSSLVKTSPTNRIVTKIMKFL